VIEAQRERVSKRVATLQRLAVGADQPWEDQEGCARNNHDGPGRPERANPRSVARERGVQQDRGNEDGEEDNSLRSRRDRQEDQ